MDISDIKSAVDDGLVLLHGCSLENLANIVSDDRLRNDLRDHAGPRGISLTRSLAVAESFGMASEEIFSEILWDWYGLKSGMATEERKGAILVFKRTDLTDLDIIHFDDFEKSGPNEHEERVLGEIDSAFARIAAIIVDRTEFDWFRSVVDEHFRKMNEPADILLSALLKCENKLTLIEKPSVVLTI